MQESAPVLVGIDVGGTKTHLRALAGDTPVADHVRASGAAGVRPSALAVGGHACETPRQCAGTRTVLRAHVDAPALVVDDAELLVPAAGLDRGVGLVAGTGSVAVGRRADGTLVQAGGWDAVSGTRVARPGWCGRRYVPAGPPMTAARLPTCRRRPCS
ncbi:hypothetical protein M878_03915, partial [Streptomyces roseochromogenus subsp. oscitans DS 12.976]